MPSNIGLNLDNSWSGSGTTAGVITFWLTGLPGDLTSRLPGSDKIHTGNMINKTFHVVFTSGTGNLVIEANEGDPSVTANWYTVTTVTASGVVTDNNLRRLVRARVVDAGGGTAVRFTASN
jgi:hypothetical protein